MAIASLHLSPYRGPVRRAAGKSGLINKRILATDWRVGAARGKPDGQTLTEKVPIRFFVASAGAARRTEAAQFSSVAH